MTGRQAVIRADASPTIGIGHVIRSRTLAAGLIACGWQTTLVTRDLPDGLLDGLGAVGVAIVRLPSGSTMGSEPAAIADRIGPGAALVVADHYGLDAAWYRGIRGRMPHAALLAIDDLADRPLPVDIVLNQNLGIVPAVYGALVPATARILAGPMYALLRPEFAGLRATGRERDGRVERLFVFISGADAPDVTARAVAGLEDLGRPIDVVVGAAYPHVARLRAAIARQATTSLFVDTDEIADLMDRADLAVGAAGSASWERCALGLPAVLVTMADNQLEGERHLVAAGAATAIGWHAAVTAVDIGRAVGALCADPERVKAMSVAARAVTDGRGTERVVAEIEAVVADRAEGS